MKFSPKVTHPALRFIHEVYELLDRAVDRSHPLADNLFDNFVALQKLAAEKRPPKNGPEKWGNENDDPAKRTVYRTIEQVPWLTFDHKEEEVARWLGLPRTLLAKTRRLNCSLARARHWEVVNRNVKYTAQGVAVLSELLGVSNPLDVLPAPQQDPVATPNPAAPGQVVEKMTLVRANWGSTGSKVVVQARRPSGEIVTVRVHSNANFVVTMANGQPMTFHAMQNPHSPQFWTLVGRSPRWKGRW